MAISQPKRICTPHDPALGELKQLLSQTGDALNGRDSWPGSQLQMCAEAGVFEWFVSSEHGGQGWNSADLCRGYLALSSACLTTTFVITQFMGACQRLAACGNRALAERWVPGMLRGQSYGTIGISHLTTSRRHLSKPVLQATATSSGFQLNGYSPWVTGGGHADVIVTGATLPDEAQILAAVPTSAPGIRIADPQPLLALAASRTGPVHFQNVEVPREWLLAGPEHDVMKRGTSANTGGVQTSTLAIGLASSALDYLAREAEQRGDLQGPAEALRNEWNDLWFDLLAVAAGERACTTEELRARANSLVLRATQAALVAAKGAGFVEGHPAGRWCREALFFLVWSCPQNVLNSNLCELAGIAD